MNSSSDNAAEFLPSQDNVFARIASRYDFLSDIFSLYCQRYWKAKMAKEMSEVPAAVILDIASGTGDIPLGILKRLKKNQNNSLNKILITDISQEMLAIAKKKIGYGDNIEYMFLDAHNLNGIADNSIDFFSISFGMKICNRKEVLKEAFRVLKPGGVFFCLEASKIPVKWLNQAYLYYMNWCMPLIGRLVTSGDSSAYNYLLKGIKEFPGQEDLANEIKGFGFNKVSYENLTFGIVALHRAVK